MSDMLLRCVAPHCSVCEVPRPANVIVTRFTRDEPLCQRHFDWLIENTTKTPQFRRIRPACKCGVEQAQFPPSKPPRPATWKEVPMVQVPVREILTKTRAFCAELAVLPPDKAISRRFQTPNKGHYFSQHLRRVAANQGLKLHWAKSSCRRTWFFWVEPITFETISFEEAG